MRALALAALLLALATPAALADDAPVAVLVGAGDIASCTAYHDRPGASIAASSDEKTAAIVQSVVDAVPDAQVFTLGDNVFLKGNLATFQSCYAPSWGAFRDRTHPALGNHEALVSGAAGYFRYFGAAAGAAGEGWYAYDVNGWRLYVLNSQKSVALDGAQYRWLKADLEANPRACTAAFWHQPVRSSGIEYGSGRAESYGKMLPLETLLFEHANDLIVNASLHAYERLGIHAPDGSPDELGQRVLLAGTGGRMTYSPTTWKTTPLAISEARISKLGVLRLELSPASYGWQFVGVDGAVLDSGSESCR